MKKIIGEKNGKKRERQRNVSLGMLSCLDKMCYIKHFYKIIVLYITQNQILKITKTVKYKLKIN